MKDELMRQVAENYMKEMQPQFDQNYRQAKWGQVISLLTLSVFVAILILLYQDKSKETIDSFTLEACKGLLEIATFIAALFVFYNIRIIRRRGWPKNSAKMF